MIQSSRQLKDLIRNLANDKKTEAHILMRNYMMERFLERISLSPYRYSFILKGGMLVAAMVGLDARSTMDMDATIKGSPLSVDAMENIVAEILSVHIDDGVTFRTLSIYEIMDKFEYPGVRVSLESIFDGVRTPLKIDISTGDAITPKEISYNFRLMFEEREISVMAYNLETVLAEKLETIISRDITNTRMRDFYDIYILTTTQGDKLNASELRKALQATAMKRESIDLFPEATAVFTDIEKNSTMQKLWRKYQQTFSYAADISWHEIIDSVYRLWDIATLEG